MATKVKRFVLFTGYEFYPAGGWQDFAGSFDTAEEAQAEYLKKRQGNCHIDWHHIVDLETGAEVK